MNRFYISHTRNDASVVECVSRAIEQHGFNCSVVEKDMSSGTNSADQLASAIKDGSYVVFVISNASIASQWCRREVEFAVRYGKTIIPIVVDVSESSLRASWVIDYIQNKEWIRWDDSGELRFSKYLQSLRPRKPKSLLKKGCKIGCICTILLIIISVLCVLYIVSSSSPDGKESREPYYGHGAPPQSILSAPTPSPLGIPYDEDADDFIAFDTIASDSVSVEPLDSDTLYVDNIAESDCDYTDYDNPTTSDGIVDDAHNDYMPIWLISTLILILGVTSFFIAKTRRLNIKLVADKDCDVFADNLKLATLSAKVVKSIKLNKGTYYIVFNTADNSNENKAITYNATKSNDLISISFADNKKEPTTVKCFIAGSTKLELERDALRAAIAQTHNQWAGQDVVILSYTYEDFERKIIEGGHQRLYDDFIENEATVAVFIISGEIGEFTVTEFEKALQAYKSGGHPQIIVFNDEQAEYHKQAQRLKELVSSEKQYWVDYDTLKTLKLQFMSTLNWLLVDAIYK